MPTSTTTKRLADQAAEAVRETRVPGLVLFALIGRLEGWASQDRRATERAEARWALREIIAAARQIVNPENNRSQP